MASGDSVRSKRILVGLALLTLGCGSEGTTPEPTVASVAVTPATVDTLFSIGETAQLFAVARDAGGAAVAGAAVSFQSSATAVAAVTPAGLVTALGNGVATITASSGSVGTPVTVRVRQKLNRVVVLPAPAGVGVGRTLAMSAGAFDQRGTAIPGLPAAAWASDNTGVARVDASGVVTGVATGSATLTASVASAADGTRSGTSVVTVTAAPPVAATVSMTATTFAPTTTEISVGGTVTWVNGSGIPHDVDFGTPDRKIAVFESGQRSLTFPTAGTFAYHCNLHAGMQGTVSVR